MMDKLYENQSYLRENETIVESCVIEDGKIWVSLKASVFFPEEGGQYADTGYLETKDGRIRVLDGQIEKGSIRYLVEKELALGEEVRCILDWDKRYMRMQQHTGEHILTGIIHNTFGYNNVGFHLSDDDYVTLDLNGVLSKEQAQEMELLANQAIYRNLPVTASYPSREELPKLSYRSKIEIEGQVRLVTVEGIDVCACCAPHVHYTGEVGLIKIAAIQNYKGGTRLHILCGQRAFLYCAAQTNRINELANSFSTKAENVVEIIEKQKTELGLAKAEIARLRQELLQNKLESLPNGEHGCLFADPDTDVNAMKYAYNELTGRFVGYSAVFVGDDEAGYRYYAGSAKLDSRELAAKMREALSAKGGGSVQMIQGKTTAKKQQIQDFWSTLGGTK